MSQVLGREYRVVKRELTDEQVEERKRAIASAHERKRTIEAEFSAFRRWAAPRIRKAVDPDYAAPKELEGAPVLSIAEAHGLRIELQRRGRHKGATIGAIKADIEAHEHAAATRCEFRRVECELVADPDKVEVIYVDVETGEAVDRRGMTADERQMALPETEKPNGKRSKKKADEAPDVVV